MKKKTKENNITIKNNIAIHKISICINDEAIRNILLVLSNGNENSRELQKEVNDYLKEIQWRTFNQKVKEYDYPFHLDNLIKEKLLRTDIVEGFKADLNTYTTTKRLDKIYETSIIAKYLKVRPFIKEQGRKDPYSGMDYENVESNIFYEFNVAEYQKISNIKNKKPLKDLLELIKLILFLDLRYYFDNGSNSDLMNQISIAVDNSIVTGLELSNNLVSSEYFYEDYCHELAQLTFESSDKSSIVNSPSKQSLTFVCRDLKPYASGGTPEEIENRGKNKIKSQINKAVTCMAGLNNSEKDDLEAQGIDEDDIEMITGEIYEDDEAGNEDGDFDIDGETRKEKVKTHIAFRRDKDVADHKGIEISAKISGRYDIQELLPLPYEIEEVMHSDNVLSNIVENEETIFNNCVLKFFKEMEQTKDDFKDIKRSTFSLDAEFIKSNIKVKNNAISRILMLIHFASSSNETDATKKRILEQFSEINKLVGKLKNIRKGASSKKAILCLYEHFKERLDVK